MLKCGISCLPTCSATSWAAKPACASSAPLLASVRAASCAARPAPLSLVASSSAAIEGKKGKLEEIHYHHARLGIDTCQCRWQDNGRTLEGSQQRTLQRGALLPRRRQLRRKVLRLRLAALQLAAGGSQLSIQTCDPLLQLGSSGCGRIQRRPQALVVGLASTELAWKGRQNDEGQG